MYAPDAWKVAKTFWSDVENIAGDIYRVVANPPYQASGIGTHELPIHIDIPPKKGSGTGPRRKRKDKSKRRGNTTQTETQPPKRQKMARKYGGNSRYVGKFRRGGNVNYNKFAKLGFLMRTEKGGVVTQDKCLYVGHSTGAQEKIKRVLFSAIIRKLFKKVGHEFASFKEEASLSHASRFGVVKLDFALSQEGTILGEDNASTAVEAGHTYETVVTNLMTAYDVATSSTNYSVHLHSIRFIPVTDAAASGLETMEFKLHLSGARIIMFVSSNLKIQNRTLSSSHTEDANHAYISDSVENNPLQGKSYYGFGNGFRYGWSNDAANSTEFFCNPLSGLITADPDEATLTAELKDLLQRPPSSRLLRHCKGSGGVMLNPGLIKGSTLRYNLNTTIDALLSALVPYSSEPATHHFRFGKSRMFALEKMMHTDDANEPDISIGYEVNNFYMGYIVCKTPSVTVDKDVL